MTTDRPDADGPDREDLAVRVDGVTKTFGTVRALDDVSFQVRRGTIHALVGENGSGKSTLTKVIAGAHAPDSGTVWSDGEALPDLTPRDARQKAPRSVHHDSPRAPRSPREDHHAGP